MNDSEIIGQILKGDKEKFRMLVEKYQQMVFRTCMGFVHDRDDADDLTQEVFISAYQSLPGFKATASFSTWIYRIAVNASLNRIRKTSKGFILQRLDALAGKNEPTINITDTEDPENILIRDEHNRWLKKAIDSLPENQRTALILSKYDDLPQKEIADIMNISEGAVEALLQRAKKNLRRKLIPKNNKRP